MKKFIAIAITVALLFSASSAFASVGYKKEGVNIGQAADINVQGNASFDGSTVTIIANGHEDGVTTNVSTESNLTSAALSYGLVQVAFSKTRYVTLANGSKGQMITFLVTSTTGKGASDAFVITDDKVSGATATALLATGWDDIALDTVGDTVTLLYLDDTYGWIIIGEVGATIT